MNAELFQLIFGGIVVCIYAFERFETPGPVRPTTTFARYWRARIGYTVCALGLYVALEIAFEVLGTSALMPFFSMRTPEGATNVSALPVPLYAALILTSLLPNTPVLRTFDDKIKRSLQRWGNIPHEVSQLAGLIRGTRLSVVPALSARLRPVLSQFGVDEDWLLAPEGSLRQRWAQVAILYALIGSWRSAPGYARYVDEQALRFDQIGKEIEEFNELMTLAARRELEQGVGPALPGNWEKQLFRKVGELHQRLCDFIAGGILQVERSPGHRSSMLKQLGFHDVPEPGPVMSINDVVSITGLIFAALVVVTVISRRFAGLPPLPSVAGDVRVFVMVPVIYAVAIALAIYPKTKFRWADMNEHGERPVAAYAASGVAAAVAALVISIVSRVVFDVYDDSCRPPVEFLDRFVTASCTAVGRWPWLAMTFFATVAIAFAADDYARKPHVPAWVRYAEAFGLALFFLALQWFVLELLPKARLYSPAELFGFFGSAMVIGGLIGFFVPQRYRSKRFHRAKGSLVPNASSGGAAMNVDEVSAVAPSGTA